MKMTFGFENLEVWSKAVDFAVKVLDIMEEKYPLSNIQG
jgi:hypothetical protein